jgi:hypothetical protein
MEMSCSPNPDTDLTRLLHLAISKGSEQAVRLYIEKGADPEQSTKDVETAILHSMMMKRYNVFLTLIELGVSLESTFFFEDDCTPLIYAMERTTPACFAKTLIINGADIDAVNYYGTVMDNFFEHGDVPWQEWSKEDELEVLGLLIKGGHHVTPDYLRKAKDFQLLILLEALGRTSDNICE